MKSWVLSSCSSLGLGGSKGKMDMRMQNKTSKRGKESLVTQELSGQGERAQNPRRKLRGSL